MSDGQRVAVVGGGISGNLVARLLHSSHDVTIFEAADYPGGHANTVACEVSGSHFEVDTGFMVFNERTYPNFCRMLKMLGIESQESDMSFSVRCQTTGLEYEGSSIRGLFPEWRNIRSGAYWGMLADILRFNRAGTKAVADNTIPDEMTVGEFLDTHRLGTTFREKYLLPMSGAIWSADPRHILDFSAKFMIGFFHNHGLMFLWDRPRWRTVVGRSQAYVQKLLEPLGSRFRLSTPVRSIFRDEDVVRVLTASGHVETFDHVILATHADQSLRMLSDPSPLEQELLSCFPYQGNDAILHTDTSLLPRNQHAWASWNYLIPEHDQRSACVTYDLSRLQNVPSATPILLSLNATRYIREDTILARMNYDHPAYQLNSFAAQKRLSEIQGRRRTYFCGAYCGYGFHEDGVNSALAVAAYFGKDLTQCEVASMKAESTTADTPR